MVATNQIECCLFHNKFLDQRPTSQFPCDFQFYLFSIVRLSDQKQEHGFQYQEAFRMFLSCANHVNKQQIVEKTIRAQVH